MGEFISSVQNIVAGFQNEDTERKIEFIEKLHTLGVDNYVPLPQLVVVGDQSSGKSAVLQAIAKLPFPTSDRMCTRFATEVALRHASHSTTISISIKIGTHDNNFTDDHQEQMLNWSPRALTDIDEIEGGEFARIFKELYEEASEMILGEERDSDLLRDATLHIDIRGPGQSNLTIVDIPGLVAVGHDAYETARALVERYIRNPRSIVLAIAHPSDPGTQQVFQILRTIENKENRVIGVITKCDRKQDGAEDWILETIKNQRGPRNQHYLKQGWFGLRNRLPSETNTSNYERNEAEARLFNEGVWSEVDRSRLGIDNLVIALQKMHNNHITTTIPELVPEIENQLMLHKSKLDQLGSSRDTRQSQLTCMVSLASEFEKMSTYAIDGYYDRLPEDPEVKVMKIIRENLATFRRSMLDGFQSLFGDHEFDLISRHEHTWQAEILRVDIYREIQDVIVDNWGREGPGEVNPCIMKVLWARKTVDWAQSATKIIDELVRSISVAVNLIFKHICSDEELRRNTQQWLSGHLTIASEQARAELAKLIADEQNGLMWSLSPSFKLTNELSENRIKTMTSKLLRLAPITGHNGADPVAAERTVKSWIGRRKDMSAIFDTFDLLSSYYHCTMNRFVDNIGHQVIERHLLGPNSPLKVFQAEYVVHTLQENEELLQQLAGENEAKVAERRELIDGKVRLEEALRTARMYGFCLQ